MLNSLHSAVWSRMATLPEMPRILCLSNMKPKFQFAFGRVTKIEIFLSRHNEEMLEIGNKPHSTSRILLHTTNGYGWVSGPDSFMESKLGISVNVNMQDATFRYSIFIFAFLCSNKRQRCLIWNCIFTAQ